MMLRRAHDVTDRVARRSLLVLAPHPDDETLGCAGRIQRAVATGASVVVVVATDGAQSHDVDDVDRDTLRALRRAELVAACEVLGVPEDHVISLGFADGSLAGSYDALVTELVALLRRVAPDDVCTTCSGESHADHATCARALDHAAREAGWTGRMLGYPIWLWSDWPVSRRHANGAAVLSALATAVRRRVEVVHLDAASLTTKRAALDCYGSQTGARAVGETSVALPVDVLRRALDGTELYFRLSPRARWGLG